MWAQRKSREWQVGDVVNLYGAHSRGRIPDSTHTITKVYKNGNFLIERKNFLGETYPMQFSAKYSDGYSAHATGEGYSRSIVRYADEEEMAKAEKARFDKRMQKVASFVGEQVAMRTQSRASKPLTAEQLARIVAVLNETA